MSASNDFLPARPGSPGARTCLRTHRRLPFDFPTLTFAGTPVEQAECLLQKVRWQGELKRQKLPKVFRALLSGERGPPAPFLASALAQFPDHYRPYAEQHANDPASQTEAGVPVRYFVIHDTSTPFLGDARFPRDLDRDWKVNAFDAYLAQEPVAHIFLNRAGQIWPGHDFARPWRATKLETRVVGVPARGRFVHIELVQPRRHTPGSTSLADTLAPKPGFSKEQYRLLAALYVYASVRAGEWLIPAFHATVDDGIPGAHDDPQNFELKAFAREVEKLVSRSRPRQQLPSTVRHPTPALPLAASAP